MSFLHTIYTIYLTVVTFYETKSGASLDVKPIFWQMPTLPTPDKKKEKTAFNLVLQQLYTLLDHFTIDLCGIMKRYKIIP